MGAGLHQMSLDPAQPAHLPGKIGHVADPDLLQHVGGLNHGPDAPEQTIVGLAALACDQDRGPEHICVG